MFDRQLACAAALAAVVALGPASAASPEPQAPKVVVVALEGVGQEELQRRLAAGGLGGGVGRLARERGGSAALVPLAAPLTLPGLVSLATGVAPGVHGVVADRFHRPQDPIGTNVDGASAPIAVETLWQAARRQGLQVGSVLWPGADGTSIERRANWAVQSGGEPQFRSQTLVLKPEKWRNELYGIGPGPALHWSLPRQVRSYSTPLTTTLPFTTGHIRFRVLYDLIAVDRTDDGKVNYDGLLVSNDVNPAKGYLGVIEPGGWFPLVLPEEASTGLAGAAQVCWLKVIDLDPVRGVSRIYASPTHVNRAYPAALSRRLSEQNLVWPGPPDGAALEQQIYGVSAIDAATLAEQLDRLTGFVFQAAQSGAKLSWDLLLVHVPTFEEAAKVAPGHRELRRALRDQAWRSVDRELDGFLATLDLGRTTVLLLSTHGAVEVDAEVDVSEVLRQDPGVQQVTAASQRWALASPYRAVANQGLVHVYLNRQGASADGFLAPEEATEFTRAIGRALTSARFEGRPIFERVWTKAQAARRGLGGPGCGDLVAYARPGLRLVDRNPNVLTAYRPPTLGYAAGFAPGEPAMRGFYRELGRAAHRPRKLEVEEIARRVAELLEMAPPGAGPR